MVRDLLEEAVAKFNRLAKEDPKVREEVADKVKTVNIQLDEGPSYHFVMDRGHIDGVHDGGIEAADIVVMVDEATLRGVFSGEVSPMKAYATKRLRLKASLTDLLTLRKFF